MFSKLAGFTSKYRVPIAIVWIAAAILLFIFSPKISEVGVTDESQFLPQNTQSSLAGQLLKDKFATTRATTGSNAIIVIYDASGLTPDDMRAAENIHDWLISGAAPAEIIRVTSVFESEALKGSLISADQTTMMISLDFSVGSLAEGAKNAIDEIRGYLQQSYPEKSIYVTGEAGLLQDMFGSVQETIDRTTIVTIALVAILLLIIYRSPVAILLPLIAIGSSFAVSAGLVGFLGQAGAKFSTLSEAYLVVIIFGIGTDYCLFLVSRFREELHVGGRQEAQSNSLRHIAPVIAASALTVIVAFLSLGISNFGMNQTTGYAMAIGVAITLLAGLTLVPALMALFGKYLFWPSKMDGTAKRRGFGWQTIGNWVGKHPVWTAVPIVLALLLPYWALTDLNRSADIVNQLPQNSGSVQGYQVMEDHFVVGELSPSYVLIESTAGDITSSASKQAIGQVVQSLESVEGVSRVNYFATPVDQLSATAVQFRGLAVAVDQGSGLDQLITIQSVGEVLQGLALQYPGILQSPNFQQLGTNLGRVSALVGQIQSGSSSNLPDLLSQLKKALNDSADNFEGLIDEFNLITSTPFTAYLYTAFFSTDKTVTRINVILIDDPNAPEALDTVTRIRLDLKDKLASTSLAGATYYVGGESATTADIMLTNDADFGRVVGLSIAGILLVIIILLRSLLAPLYMVATVLLNYGTTLGIATWLFIDVLKHTSMIYMIPLFIFVILVALGADYNIFLVSRIREESYDKPIREAVSRAVANTGGVITACGIILAGTFATLMTSPLQVVFQIGAAISIGVLIDTFLVRALLVPALARMTNRWSWWPSRLFRQAVKQNLKQEAGVKPPSP